jgi:hypothetical protein
MGLFNSLKQEHQQKSEGNNILLAMPMFNNNDRYEVQKVIENLRSLWQFEIRDFGGDDDAAVFTINDEPVAIAYISVPIPSGDIEGTAQYAYNWTTALHDLKHHTGHALVTLMGSEKSTLERFRILSKVLCSMLLTSNAIGVYFGEQCLLIPSKQYFERIDQLKEGDIPVMLWVYIGLRKILTGNCAYTWGLRAFKKPEIEIIDSQLPLEDLLELLVNIIAYVVGSDAALENGQTIGLTADQKIAITVSKGRFVDGETIKLEF